MCKIKNSNPAVQPAVLNPEVKKKALINKVTMCMALTLIGLIVTYLLVCYALKDVIKVNFEAIIAAGVVSVGFVVAIMGYGNQKTSISSPEFDT